MTNAKRLHRYLNAMHVYGITEEDALALRRIQMTLRRWHELECGDSNNYASWAIERDDETEVPYMIRHTYTGGNSRRSRTRVPDREKGALKRLTAIMERYPALVPYVQSDPRGCALYVVRKADIPTLDRMEWLKSNPVDKSEAGWRRRNACQIESYYTRGIPCTEE